MEIKTALKSVVGDRAFLAGMLVVLACMAIVVILSALYIRPNALVVPVHFSSYGQQRIYTDKWYYQLTFVIFGVLVAIVNILLSMKLYVVKGRALALTFLWFSAILMAIIALDISAILKGASLVR
jgi:hypothetical protein